MNMRKIKETIKIKFFKLTSLLLLIVFLFSGEVALAADNTSMVQLQLKPFLSGINAEGYNEAASSNNPGIAVGFLYRVAMAVVGLVAFGSLVYAGILRTWGAVGNSGLVKEADERIKGTLWGILLLAGAAVIFNTINPQINNVGAIGEGINQNMPVIQSPISSSSLFSQALDFFRPAGETYSEAESRSQLARYGIGTKPACAEGQTTNCVSFNGMQIDTMAEILSLGKAVGGNNVFVTGGTEGGHTVGSYDHGGGYKFDVRPNNVLDNYIIRSGNFTYMGTRSDGAPQYKSKSTGAIYAKEGDHWDVLVKPVGTTFPGA